MYCLSQLNLRDYFLFILIILFIIFIIVLLFNFILGIVSFRKIEYRDYFQNLPRNTNYSDILPGSAQRRPLLVSAA